MTPESGIKKATAGESDLDYCVEGPNGFRFADPAYAMAYGNASEKSACVRLTQKVHEMGDTGSCGHGPGITFANLAYAHAFGPAAGSPECEARLQAQQIHHYRGDALQ